MKPVEKKNVCNLISLVANAVATDTIPEAEDYLVDQSDLYDDDLIEHTLNVLTSIKNKQEQYEVQSYCRISSSPQIQYLQ